MTSEFAFVFEGDGRNKVEAKPEWNMPGHPIRLRRCTARKLARLFEERGTHYSATGGTLWAIVAWAQYKGEGLQVLPCEYGGFYARKPH